MKVASLCSTDLITVEVTDTLFEAAQKMARNHVGALAVLDEGTLVGVLSEAYGLSQPPEREVWEFLQSAAEHGLVQEHSIGKGRGGDG